MSSNGVKKRKRKEKRETAKNTFLLKLADACNQHKRSHLHKEGGEDHHDDTVPNCCQEDLHTMKRILLRVEKQYVIGDSDGGEKFRDIENLCMLYRSIAADMFCPYAMRLLFQDGKEGIESTFQNTWIYLLNTFLLFISFLFLISSSFASGPSSSLPPFF